MLAGGLHAAVGMRHEVGSGTVTGQRHLQSIDHQATVDPLRHRPADDLPREQILDGRQGQPPFVGGDIGDVAVQVLFFWEGWKFRFTRFSATGCG